MDRKSIFLVGLLMTFIMSMSANAQQLTVVDTLFDRAKYEDAFAFGSDISFFNGGTGYKNHSGQNQNLMDILQKEEGINAVRFRVWVPENGSNGKTQVLNQCRMAAARGLKIMIAFHYSDTWADSGSQTIPSSWKDHSVDGLCKSIYNHTFDILNSLKKEGIHPVWVGMGNETKYGMLYDVGKTREAGGHSASEGYQNFTKFINSAYKAIKDVDPNMLAIVHLPNGHDLASAKSMFNNLNKYGANYDVIGLSAYPRWSHLDISSDAAIQSTINTFMSTFKELKATFKKPVMVVETGHYVDQPLDANRFLAEFMKSLIADGELGCFYWEPEMSSGYELGAWDGATNQATIAMDAFKGWKHTKVDKYLTLNLRNPSESYVSNDGKGVEFKAYAKTGNTITKISKVDFYLNGKMVQSVTSPLAGSNYIFTPDSLTPNTYDFFAIGYDNQGHSQRSDTISFIVGPFTMFQESANSWMGVDGGNGEVMAKNSGYTDKGYIHFEAAKGISTSWLANFPSAGTYKVTYRYSTDVESQRTKIYVDDEFKMLATFNKTKSLTKWKFVTKSITVDSPGPHFVRLYSMTNDGLPNIDYMAIFSPEGVSLVEEGDVSSIESLHNDDNAPSGIVYDLSGRVVSKKKIATLPPGIYIVDGHKMLVK